MQSLICIMTVFYYSNINVLKIDTAKLLLCIGRLVNDLQLKYN